MLVSSPLGSPYGVDHRAAPPEGPPRTPTSALCLSGLQYRVFDCTTTVVERPARMCSIACDRRIGTSRRPRFGRQAAQPRYLVVARPQMIAISIRSVAFSLSSICVATRVKRRTIHFFLNLGLDSEWALCSRFIHNTTRKRSQAQDIHSRFTPSFRGFVVARVGGCGLRHVDEAKQEARARACAARGNSCTPSPAQ